MEASVCSIPPEYALIHVENPGSGLSPSSCPQETAAIPAVRHNIVLKRPLAEVLMVRNADVSVLPIIVKFTLRQRYLFFPHIKYNSPCSGIRDIKTGRTAGAILPEKVSVRTDYWNCTNSMSLAARAARSLSFPAFSRFALTCSALPWRAAMTALR